MIDSHIHLDADQYADVAGLIKRARDAGVTAVFAPGITLDSNRRVLELAREYPDFVHPAIGFHPERFELTDDDLEATIAMARKYRDRICALGEVGLPYYGEQTGREDVAARGRMILARFAKARHRTRSRADPSLPHTIPRVRLYQSSPPRTFAARFSIGTSPTRPRRARSSTTDPSSR